jgi:hypothetical protein
MASHPNEGVGGPARQGGSVVKQGYRREGEKVHRKRSGIPRISGTIRVAIKEALCGVLMTRGGLVAVGKHFGGSRPGRVNKKAGALWKAPAGNTLESSVAGCDDDLSGEELTSGFDLDGIRTGIH